MSKYVDSQIRTARKPHICLTCEEAIAAGEKYLALQAGMKHRFPLCLACAEKQYRGRLRCMPALPAMAQPTEQTK